MASQGVIVVSFNYRLGRFVAFAHPLLTKANADGGKIANYATLDQLAALQWVQRNIAKFGGDPSKVTIMGESAGGIDIHELLVQPSAKGLFRGAIVMSGSDGTAVDNGSLAEAEQIGVRFAASKGISADDPQALVKLRALSAEQVTDGLNMSALFRLSSAPRPSPFPSPTARPT